MSTHFLETCAYTFYRANLSLLCGAKCDSWNCHRRRLYAGPAVFLISIDLLMAYTYLRHLNKRLANFFNNPTRSLLALVSLLFLLACSIVFQYYKSIINEHITNGSCVIVVQEMRGRLGNQMFMYASAYGLARRRHCLMYIDLRLLNTLRTIFLIDESRLISATDLSLLKNIPTVWNSACMYYPSLMEHNKLNRSLRLMGYWQSYKYFVDYSKEIRLQFSLNTNILQKAQTYIRSLQMKTTLVGVHIRRGDFLSFGYRLRGVVASSFAYINASMSYYTSIHPDSFFIVSSDDKQWCRTMFSNRSDVVVTSDAYSPSEDLAILTACNHSLVTTGTFSWWTAFLTNGQVIYDKSYPKQGSFLARNCPQQDFFPSWFKACDY